MGKFKDIKLGDEVFYGDANHEYWEMGRVIDMTPHYPKIIKVINAAKLITVLSEFDSSSEYMLNDNVSVNVTGNGISSYVVSTTNEVFLSKTFGGITTSNPIFYYDTYYKQIKVGKILKKSSYISNISIFDVLFDENIKINFKAFDSMAVKCLGVHNPNDMAVIPDYMVDMIKKGSAVYIATSCYDLFKIIRYHHQKEKNAKNPQKSCITKEKLEALIKACSVPSISTFGQLSEQKSLFVGERGKRNTATYKVKQVQINKKTPTTVEKRYCDIEVESNAIVHCRNVREYWDSNKYNRFKNLCIDENISLHSINGRELIISTDENLLTERLDNDELFSRLFPGDIGYRTLFELQNNDTVWYMNLNEGKIEEGTVINNIPYEYENSRQISLKYNSDNTIKIIEVNNKTLQTNYYPDSNIVISSKRSDIFDIQNLFKKPARRILFLNTTEDDYSYLLKIPFYEIDIVNSIDEFINKSPKNGNGKSPKNEYEKYIPIYDVYIMTECNLLPVFKGNNTFTLTDKYNCDFDDLLTDENNGFKVSEYIIRRLRTANIFQGFSPVVVMDGSCGTKCLYNGTQEKCVRKIYNFPSPIDLIVEIEKLIIESRYKLL
jgi:hypothetical protein